MPTIANFIHFLGHVDFMVTSLKKNADVNTSLPLAPDSTPGRRQFRVMYETGLGLAITYFRLSTWTAMGPDGT